MPKKSEEKGGDYYAYLDEGCAVEFLDLGIKFKQGEPHKIPALYIEDIDKDPNYGKCADGEKKLTATECQALRKKEMAKAKTARDTWRKNRASGKARTLANAPPADVPTLGVKQDE